MENCNGAVTPMEAGIQLWRAQDSIDQDSDEQDPKDRQLYQSLVGSLMYLMTATRPDLAYTVSMLSKFNSAPTNEHMSATKCILRYLKQTRKLGLTYSGSNVGIPKLIDYSDSDHAEDRNDRKSTSGYVFTLQGAALLWKSNKQSMVTLSSTEAKYVGSSEAAREGIWLRCLLNDFMDPPRENVVAEASRTCEPQLLYMDNQSAM